jgi:pilus assembly protein CpaB
MKKNSLLTLLGIALVVAIISTGIFYGLFVNRLSSSSGSGTLVVASRALKAGTMLTANDVKLVPWPGAQLPKGAFARLDQVQGQTLFDALAEDEPVLAWRLASADGAGSAGIPAGMRAVSVHVSDSTGVLALLRSGHKVDVQVVRRLDQTSAEVRTALQNLQVLSVNPQPQPSSQGFNLPVVTLLANPADADVLAAADAGARVRLSLRNPLDEETKRRSTLTLDAVMRRTGGAQ